MVVTLGDRHQLQFFRSSDLLHWGDQPISTFGPDGDSSADWETPDLFHLPVDGDPTHIQWVLTIGVSPNRMRYFIGNFDGTRFANLYPGKVLTVDSGPDFYAARTWREFDGPQTITPLLGWMGNWQYSRYAPSQLTYGGEGVVSIPRNLALKSTADGIRLTQTPIPALQQLRQAESTADNIAVSGTHPITDFVPFHPRENSYEIDATFHVLSGAVPFGFHLLTNAAHTRRLTLRYDPAQSSLTIDRSIASDATLNRDFTAPLPPVHVETVDGQLRLHLFIDKSSVEIFTNDGNVVITALTYPGEDQRGIELFSTGSATTLAHLSAWASLLHLKRITRLHDPVRLHLQARSTRGRLGHHLLREASSVSKDRFTSMLIGIMRGSPFFVLVRSITPADRSMFFRIRPYCSLSRIPDRVEMTNSGRRWGQSSMMAALSINSSEAVKWHYKWHQRISTCGRVVPGGGLEPPRPVRVCGF